jgi:RNA polymerase sigma-70 factor (ECF subfamily)
MIDTIFSNEFLSRLRAFIRRRVESDADADDLLQDVLAKLVERGGSVSEESVPAWLFTVARRAIIDRYRSRSATITSEEDLTRSDEPGGDASGELALCLEPMLTLLDKEDQELLRRVDMKGQSQAEIARELGVAVSTVKSRTQRARARLYAVLTDCCSVATDSRGRPYDFELRKGKSCSRCRPDEGGCA